MQQIIVDYISKSVYNYPVSAGERGRSPRIRENRQSGQIILPALLFSNDYLHTTPDPAK